MVAHQTEGKTMSDLDILADEYFAAQSDGDYEAADARYDDMVRLYGGDTEYVNEVIRELSEAYGI